MCGAPERLSAFGARTFPTVITTSMDQDLNLHCTMYTFTLKQLYTCTALKYTVEI
jgi:hypothetical protein